MHILAGFLTFFLFLPHCGLLCGVDALAQQKKQMLSDLDFITNIFEISYAPLTWKLENYGWDLEAERIKAKNLVINDPFLKQKAFQKIIKEFCQSTKDYHVVPDFYSTEESSLPFCIKCAEGKYFVSYIKEDFLLSQPSLLSIGDEVLSINGRPISEAVQEFRLREFGSNFIGTDQALAEFYFTSRFGNLGHDIPHGTAEIIYRKAFEKEKHAISLKWDYESEKILTNDLSFFKKSEMQNKQTFQENPWKKLFMTSHYFRKRAHKASNEDTANLFGGKKSFIPPLGTILFEIEGGEFHAYLFEIQDNVIGGYIRIPSYYAEDVNEAAMEFSDIIEFFEEVSHVLVIDQLNNAGGKILYLYALLSMLTDRELELPKHQMMLTQEDLYLAINRFLFLQKVKNDRGARKKFGETLEGFVVNYQLVKSFLNSYQFTMDQWEAGKRLTDYTYLYGIEKISPHPEVRYTKPILLLINHLNFSAADFFAAIMQDNKRAKLMGTRTAGAGGYIERIFFPNLNGIEGIDITASFSMRPNGMPIENFGVDPDILYEASQKDLQNNYSEYKKNILKELEVLLLHSSYNSKNLSHKP